MGRTDFADLQAERSYSGQRAYNPSKLANVLFSCGRAARLSGTPVTANVLHPGVVARAFGAEDPGPPHGFRLWQVSTAPAGLESDSERRTNRP